MDILNYGGTPLIRPPNRPGQSGLNSEVVLIVNWTRTGTGHKNYSDRRDVIYGYSAITAVNLCLRNPCLMFNVLQCTNVKLKWLLSYKSVSHCPPPPPLLRKKMKWIRNENTWQKQQAWTTLSAGFVKTEKPAFPNSILRNSESRDIHNVDMCEILHRVAHWLRKLSLIFFRRCLTLIPRLQIHQIHNRNNCILQHLAAVDVLIIEHGTVEEKPEFP